MKTQTRTSTQLKRGGCRQGFSDTSVVMSGGDAGIITNNHPVTEELNSIKAAIDFLVLRDKITVFVNGVDMARAYITASVPYALYNCLTGKLSIKNILSIAYT